MRVAVCFSCNEAYMPLCKGLVLSLVETARFFPRDLRVTLHFIDIGCLPASLAWLEEQGVHPHSFSRADYPLLPRQDLLPRYADAQLCRPFLPRIIPGYDCYIWIDTDIWIQAADTIPTAAQSIAGFQNKILICPEHHYGYIGHRSLRLALPALRGWYLALYGDEELALELSHQPVFNSGFFAMLAQNPLWEAWADELAFVYGRDHSANPGVLHYAEQFALNRVAYARNAILPLDPLFNYACGGSVAFRNPRGKVVVGYPPCPPVKGVHLLFFSRYGAMYLDKGLLYQGGEYLADEERAALRSLVRTQS